MASSLRVSVVLPCLNEEPNLRRVLEALLAQDLPRDAFEVVLVDGGSVDGSVGVAESLGVRVVHAPRGVSVQRNRGAAEVTAPVLAFLDADCVVPPDWLSRGLGMIEEQGAALAGGPTRSPAGSSWLARAWDVHLQARAGRLFADDEQRYRLIATASLFVRRDAFERVGGFDETLSSSEDSFLCAEIAHRGLPIAYDEHMEVLHLGAPGSPRAFFRQQVWHSNREVWRRLSERTGAVAAQSARRYGLMTVGTLSLVAAGAVVSTVFLSAWPFLAALAGYAAVPVALAVRTSLRVGSARCLLPLAGMYAIYGFARAVHLLGLARLEYRRSVPTDQERRGN